MSTNNLPTPCQAVKPGAPLPSSQAFYDERKNETAALCALLRPFPLRHKTCGRLNDCAALLGFSQKVEGWKLVRASFCRVRFCPMCQLRRSRQWLAKFYQAAPAVQAQYPTDRFLLLTLTVRNCQPKDLRATLQEMTAGWKRLSLSKEFRAVRGFIRSTEITRGADGSAHPHFHVLLQVRPSYFAADYVKQSDWVEAWQRAARLDYVPVVDVRRVKPLKDAPEGLSPSLAGAVEVLKYTAKGSDLLANATWTDTVMTQTHRLRFLATGGCWKDVMADDEDDTPTNLDESAEPHEADPVWLWGWQAIASRYQSVGQSARSRALAA